MMHWAMVIGLCLAFGCLLKLMDNAFAEENARQRRIRRLEKSQEHAMRSAEDLRVFDQTLTQEQLIREWEKMK
jgi:hypothetical protein